MKIPFFLVALFLESLEQRGTRRELRSGSFITKKFKVLHLNLHSMESKLDFFLDSFFF